MGVNAAKSQARGDDAMTTPVTRRRLQRPVHRVHERPVARALPARDDVVHGVAERNVRVGVGETEGAAGAEVAEAVRVGTERSAGDGRLEAEAERHVLVQNRAVAL